MTNKEQIKELEYFAELNIDYTVLDGNEEYATEVNIDYKGFAEALYNAGYRKIDEVRKETAKGIYGQIEKSDILIVDTQEYGEIEVVPIERLNEIFRSKGVKVE